MPTSCKLQEVRIICFTHWCIPSAQNNLSFSTHLFKLCIYNNTFWVDILFNEKGKTLVFWKNFEFLIYLLVFIRNQVLFLFFFFLHFGKIRRYYVFSRFLNRLSKLISSGTTFMLRMIFQVLRNMAFHKHFCFVL